MAGLSAPPGVHAKLTAMAFAWLALAVFGATLLTALLGHWAAIAGGAHALDRTSGVSDIAPLTPLANGWVRNALWAGGIGGFVIAAMTLMFGKRPGWFAGVFGIVVGAAVGIGYAYYQGLTWVPGAG